MKRILKIMFSIVLSLSIFVTPAYAQNNVLSMNSIGTHLKINKKYSDSLLYSRLYPMWKYAEDNNIKIYDFKERTKVMKFLNRDDLNNISNELIFMEDRSNFSLSSVESKKYKKTLEQTDLLYYGGLKDNSTPDGLGLLMQIYDEEPFMEPQLFIKYIGYFKKGEFSGYGVKFNTERNVYKLLSPTYEESAVLEANPNLFNDIHISEGYFKNGRLQGKAVEYSSDILVAINQGTVSTDATASMLNYDITYGTYKKGELNGEMKSYIKNNLYYDGEVKNGEYHGDGKLYFYDSTQLQYEGEFRSGKYSGEGILYDKDGSILHKGEFYAGDIK